MDNLLETHNLTKRFGHGTSSQLAVDGINLHVPTARIYGLLGPNGAGKSTTLKMLTGMLRPTSGEMIFDGHPWCRDDLYQIGALIETPALYPNLTAVENLRVRTTLLGITDERIAAVLDTVDLAETGRKRAGQFSLGMKQRLGIALALLAQPKLLIIDEPTNGLDPIGIEQLRHLVRSFADEGITVIISSHILSEVVQMADHVGIINQSVLAYESELDQNVDLEALFMDVCRAGAR